MFKSIYVKNFKPFRTVTLPLSRINLLIGPNNAGKTSILEAIMTMKYIFSNEYGWRMEKVYSFFEDKKIPKFTPRIDFKRLVYAQDEKKEIKLGCAITKEEKEVSKIFGFSPSRGSYEIESQGKTFLVEGKMERSEKYEIKENSFGEVKAGAGSFNSLFIINTGLSEIEEIGLNFRDAVGKIFFIHSYRGTHESLREIPSNLYKPEEATLKNAFDILYFIRERAGYEYIVKTINDFLKKYGLDNIRALPAPQNHYEVVVKDAELNIDINISQIGFGINQLLPMIILLSYYPDESLILIEQPELHMHPRMQAEFASLLPELIEKKKHQILIETHSEHIIFSLLNLIAKKTLNISDLNIFYVKKEGKEAKCEKLKITDIGTIEGGLPEFFEGDIDILVEWMKAISKE
ncbi:MAG: hypothetical protein EFT35_00755 [Methanophagales archaeon ANME-1-THS]|nr:MAG: hypothetical protein EFT35_00755 [Methanophagales archaeon ANME-1-THS]